MTIEYTEASIFSSDAQTLVNPVNTRGVMGKGLALEFRKLYPEMFRRYQEICANGSLRIGTLHVFRSPTKWIMSFPTKTDWWLPSRIEWVELGLDRFAATYAARGITSASFPKLGCGNGGLRWDVVRGLMEVHLGPLPIPIRIHVC